MSAVGTARGSTRPLTPSLTSQLAAELLTHLRGLAHLSGTPGVNPLDTVTNRRARRDSSSTALGAWARQGLQLHHRMLRSSSTALGADLKPHAMDQRTVLMAAANAGIPLPRVALPTSGVVSFKRDQVRSQSIPEHMLRATSAFVLILSEVFIIN